MKAISEVEDFKQNKKNNNIRINNNKNNHNNNLVNIDIIDKKIIELLLANHDNSFISQKLGIPLSTIQRRTRKLFEKEIISMKTELNYEKLGYKRGLLHGELSKHNARIFAIITISRHCCINLRLLSFKMLMMS